MKKIFLPEAKQNNGIVSCFIDTFPDENGVLNTTEIILNSSTDCYFAGCQRQAINYPPDHTPFPDGFNQLQAMVLEKKSQAKEGGMLLLSKLDDGNYLVILPMVISDCMSWLTVENNAYVLKTGHLGVETYKGEVPLLAWAVDNNLYRASETVWDLALAHPALAGSCRKRNMKHYPEIFSYLGYCTWEEYKFNINEKILEEALYKISNNDLPIRYFLVDDGHDINNPDGRRRMMTFQPDPEKFPNGWSFMEKWKKPDKVKWFGLWHCFSGWWGGIDKNNHFGCLNEHLMEVDNGILQPKDNELASTAFYDAYIKSAYESGFDYMKVDVQAKNVTFYHGKDNAVRPAAKNSQALETACARYMHGLINCMAHNSICAFNSRMSAVTRCSEDYKANDAWRGKFHIYNSYQNMLWFGHTVWGDHDMVHSNDKICAQLMSISKAMSGGPVYMSDNPDNFDADNIKPLCYNDGKILRPEAPAAPLPDSAFSEPFNKAEPYRVIAPLANGCAAVAAYNLTTSEQAVRGSFSQSDYQWAGGMTQSGSRHWTLPEEGLVFYDWKAGKVYDINTEAYKFELDGFTDIFGIMCPVINDWAVIGRPDKYLSPVAIEVISSDKDKLILRIIETAPILVWSRNENIHCDSERVDKLEQGLYRINLEFGEKNKVIIVKR